MYRTRVHLRCVISTEPGRVFAPQQTPRTENKNNRNTVVTIRHWCVS